MTETRTHEQGESHEIRIEKAEPADYEAIIGLIEEVWQQLDRKEWFVADNAQYTRELLSSGTGRAYKATDCETGRLAGIFIAALPGISQENLGYDIGLSRKELSLVAHMDTAAVLPKYRGQKLQYRLMQMAEKELKAEGLRYLMCTVHPQNRYSRENVLRQGYEVVATKEKYGGYLRDILLKRL